MYSILICDKLASERKALLRLCKQLNCTVTFSVDTNEVLRLVLSHTYDLLFIDLDEGERDALIAVASIKRVFPDLPILLTGNGILEGASRFNYENLYYFEKPLNSNSLQEFLLTLADLEEKHLEISSPQVNPS